MKTEKHYLCPYCGEAFEVAAIPFHMIDWPSGQQPCAGSSYEGSPLPLPAAVVPTKPTKGFFHNVVVVLLGTWYLIVQFVWSMTAVCLWLSIPTFIAAFLVYAIVHFVVKYW